MTELNLGHNRFSRLTRDMFLTLTKLRTLDMHGNNLMYLEPGVFRDLDSLQVLSLAGDELNETNLVPDIWLDVSDTLTQLDLAFGYSRLSTNTFTNFTKLKTLGIGTISMWDVRFLSALALTELSLNPHCLFNKQIPELQFTVFQPGLFKDFSGLMKLVLRNSLVSVIHSGAFGGLHKLVILELTDNRISTIMPGAFRGLSSLRTLGLAYNQLKTLEWNAFDPMDFTQHGGHPGAHLCYECNCNIPQTVQYLFGNMRAGTGATALAKCTHVK